MFAIPGGQTFYSVLIAASKKHDAVTTARSEPFSWLLAAQAAVMLVLQILQMRQCSCWSQC